MQKMMHFYKEVHHISMVCRVFHIFRVILDNWTLLETNTEQLNQTTQVDAHVFNLLITL